ncbi:metallophosphoesterase [Alphaproteobacteria bacterium]|nr:metallophosphoesterase [Alphaproteobacteria bacterium]
MSLVDYAKTDRHREAMQVWEECGRNSARAAGVLGISQSTMRDYVSITKNTAAAAGYSENWDARRHVPEGEFVIGRSIYTSDDEGNKAWLKTKRTMTEAARDKALQGFVDGLVKGVKPYKPKAKPKTKKFATDLLPAIVIGDAHFGMRADARETKTRDYDTKIASNDMLAAIEYLVELAPASEKCLLVNVGDFIHANGSSGTTFGGTKLDVDTRIEVVLEIAAQTFLYAIDKLLAKHKSCVVVMARGNHDSDTAIALALILKFYYSKEPRVTILDPHGFFHTVQFGKNLLAVHHGDKVKAVKLGAILPKMLPEQWSETVYRKWLVGHIHHQNAIETDNGVFVEAFGTLAPPDSWHAGAGYGSASVMNQVVFHRDGGEVIRHVYQIRDSRKVPDLTL